MAILDRDNNTVVVRVIYDGPPGAGKTTSVKALAGDLASSVYSPEERDGRTLYFDWMDCTRGKFGSYDVRFQVVSVPGQAMLAPRRRLLLETADAVVFVSDTSADAVAATRSYLTGLSQVLGTVSGPPVGVVVQANKRDVPDAVSLDELRRHLTARHDVAVVESVATGGRGLREALTLAIRLALDRVREQMKNGSFRDGRPEIDDGPALLAYLQAAEGKRPDGDSPFFRHTPLLDLVDLPPAAQAIEEALTAESGGHRAEPAGGAFRFDATVPSGMIWPPVTGRVMLHEVSAFDVATPARLPNGDEMAELGPPGNSWRAHCPASCVFRSLEEGRAVLIEWARMHAASLPVLSAPRCAVLVEAGDGTWKLWQIVKVQPSLRETLGLALAGGSPEAAAESLRATSRQLLEAEARFRAAGSPLRAHLAAVGEGEKGPVYVGLMPDPASIPEGGLMEPSELLRRELAPVLAGLTAGLKKEVLRILHQSAPDPALTLPAARTLGELLK